MSRKRQRTWWSCPECHQSVPVTVETDAVVDDDGAAVFLRLPDRALGEVLAHYWAHRQEKMPVCDWSDEEREGFLREMVRDQYGCEEAAS